MLRNWDSSLQTLRGININFVPNDLTGERDDVVGVRVRHENTAGLQELGSRVQALRAEFIVTEGPKQLAHQDVSLDVSLEHAHIPSEESHPILKVLLNDHVS